MRTFYSPQDDSEEPVTCKCVPVKTVVVAIQAIAILMLLAGIVYENTKVFNIIACCAIAYIFITLIGFYIEQKVIMAVHVGFCLIAIVLPIVCTVYVVFFYIKGLFGGKPDNGATLLLVIFAFFVTLSVLYYTWLCHQLVRAVRYKTETLPEFDTTQGLFQFHADAYDGEERSKLMYPKL